MLSLVWGKSDPYKSLRAHMLDVGHCAIAYLSATSSASLLSFLMEMWQCTDKQAIGMAAYLFSLHDIGKASPYFQRTDEGMLKRWTDAGYVSMFSRLHDTGHGHSFRHEHYSASIMMRMWLRRDMDKNTAVAYARVLSLHHQKPGGDRHTEHVHSRWEDIQCELEAEMRMRFLPLHELPTPVHVDAACILLTGVLILCDWVASSEPFASLDEDDVEYDARSSDTAYRTLRAYGLVSDEHFPGIKTFSDMWPALRAPRPLQIACEGLEFSAPLTIIEDCMGAGKTEAALYVGGRMCASYRKRSMYVALPTQATSNQMYSRVSAMLDGVGAGGARLLHSSAAFQRQPQIQSEDGNDALAWLRPMRLGLLGESAVGTVDQAMAGVLTARFSVLRLLGLANKVLIIDELHAYDAYMGQIIASLLMWCRALRVPVVLLSATLQESQKRKYLACYDVDEATLLDQAYPLITQAHADGRLAQLPVRAAFATEYAFRPVRHICSPEEIAERAVQKVERGGCLCVLVNTVKRAQAVYQALLERRPDDAQTLLFHARFTVGRRDEIEKQCLDWFGREGIGDRAGRKRILVATQVVEQSLDIDFDAMISELAPIDLLLQRIGRVFRFLALARPDGFTAPVMEILLPGDDASEALQARYGLSGHVYDPFLLRNTEILLASERVVRLPEDMRGVIETVYGNVTDEVIQAYFARQIGQEQERNAAKAVLFSDPSSDVFFPTQQQGLFDTLEPDDGFAPFAHAGTRLGEPTQRVVFCPDELYDKLLRGRLTPVENRLLYMNSASVRLRGFSHASAVDGDGCRCIQKGALRGCYALRGEHEGRIGKFHITNDNTLGVTWEADDD